MSRMASIRACGLWLLPLLACAQVTVSRASLLVRLLPFCSRELPGDWPPPCTADGMSGPPTDGLDGVPRTASSS